MNNKKKSKIDFNDIGWWLYNVLIEKPLDLKARLEKQIGCLSMIMFTIIGLFLVFYIFPLVMSKSIGEDELNAEFQVGETVELKPINGQGAFLVITGTSYVPGLWTGTGTLEGDLFLEPREGFRFLFSGASDGSIVMNWLNKDGQAEVWFIDEEELTIAKEWNPKSRFIRSARIRIEVKSITISS